VQQKYGPDKVAVVLLSVDPGHYHKDDRYIAQAKKLLDQYKVDWSNVFLPGGWDDAMRTFNASGYGKMVVDGKGIVRGVNVHGGELERLVKQLLSNPSADKPQR
jgi:hypothetical protein